MPIDERNLDEIFTELVTEHQARIYGSIYAMVQHSADTEDLVQRTLITLWRKFDTFDQSSDFCAWAYTTARYEVLNFQRSGRRPNLFAEVVINRIADRVATLTFDEAQHEALHACAEDLSPEDRQLLELRYVEDQKLKEMAAQLGRSEQSLSNSLTRVRRWLFECISRRLSQGGDQ